MELEIKHVMGWFICCRVFGNTIAIEVLLVFS